jgi:hypothetical protein
MGKKNWMGIFETCCLAAAFHISREATIPLIGARVTTWLDIPLRTVSPSSGSISSKKLGHLAANVKETEFPL